VCCEARKATILLVWPAPLDQHNLLGTLVWERKLAISHQSRIEREIEIFKDQINIHDLPEIFHYWSNKHLPPFLDQTFGIGNNIAIFAQSLSDSIQATGNREIVSVGAGDGWAEIAIAKKMRADGAGDFVINCLELSPHLIERGRAAVAAADLNPFVHFIEIDLNAWAPSQRYGAAFAHHSLHHIVNLEHVFGCNHGGLEEAGSFVCADMIGRNGHMRWPEVLLLMDGIWSRIPKLFKYNHQFQRVIDPYLNWDCSGEGFEGIRAQDILPLLVQQFHFERFCAWGGLLDQFIDRGYGHNFNPTDPEHQQFIDDLWAADRALIRLGATTPTQMIAVMKKTPCDLTSSDGLSPARCVRPPDPSATPV
jgi:SAM-dependent methyltransferase